MVLKDRDGEAVFVRETVAAADTLRVIVAEPVTVGTTLREIEADAVGEAATLRVHVVDGDIELEIVCEGVTLGMSTPGASQQACVTVMPHGRPLPAQPASFRRRAPPSR